MHDRFLQLLDAMIEGKPLAPVFEPRRFVGALADHTPQRTVGVGRMFARMDDNLIGVSAADYANGGLP